MVVAPDPDPGKNLIKQADRENHGGRERGGQERQPPPQRHFGLGKRGQLVGQPAQALVAFNHRRAAQFRGRRKPFQFFDVGDFRHSLDCFPFVSSVLSYSSVLNGAWLSGIAGFGLRTRAR